MKRGGFLKRKSKPMKRTRLHLVGRSTTAELKRDIQATLREIVMKRDKVCLLSKYPHSGACGGFNGKGELILQAEHLHTRSNARSFADSRLVVLLCQRHHIYWKPQHADEYYRIIKQEIGKERSDLLERVQQDRTPYKTDLKLELLALKMELKHYE